MKRRSAAYLFALAVGIVWIASFSPSMLAQEAGQIVAIVNKANAAPVDKASASKLLRGVLTSWPNGQRVQVALTPRGSLERIAVLKKICDMTEAEFTRSNLQAAFTGADVAKMHEAPSDAAVKSFVIATPGAIGFVKKAEVDDTVKAVLTLD